MLDVSPDGYWVLWSGLRLGEQLPSSPYCWQSHSLLEWIPTGPDSLLSRSGSHTGFLALDLATLVRVSGPVDSSVSQLWEWLTASPLEVRSVTTFFHPLRLLTLLSSLGTDLHASLLPLMAVLQGPYLCTALCLYEPGSRHKFGYSFLFFCWFHWNWSHVLAGLRRRGWP